MPALWGYVRDLYQTPGFGDQVHFDQIREHYYGVHTTINPTRIVPVGPDLRGLLTPHHREQLGGRPFGDGTAPERVEPHGGFGAPPDGTTPPVLTDTLTERIGLD